MNTIDDINTLEWLPIPQFPVYEVSEYGHIRRLIPAKRYPKGRVIKPFPDRNGYLFIRLFIDGKFYQKGVHHFVASAFIRLPKDNEECDHIDLDKANNHYTNLRWLTHKQNCQAQGKFYRERRKTIPRGEDFSHHALKEADIPLIFDMARQYKTQNDIALHFQVSSTLIHQVLHGKVWAHVVTNRTLPRKQVFKAKLRAEDVPDIRRMYSKGLTYEEIAQTYKVSDTAIGALIRGETFKDIPD